ncbi:MAG: DUF1501 domain-containing protein [Spirosomataceae bacterium]
MNTLSRKEFLQRSLLATAGTMLIPNFLKAYERNRLGMSQTTDKTVVIVQLSGGNDGLNTVVPYQNDLYYQARPRIGIAKDKVLRLTDEIGLNPALEKLRSLYDDGMVTIVNNVGYPNPDRSHFRSMDIWHTASEATEYLNSGWIGRFLDAQCAGACTPYNALEVDDTLSLALKGEKVKGIALLNPQKLYQETQGKFMANLTQVKHEDNDSVHYLYKTLSETVSSAEYIYNKAKVQRSTANYPANNELGQRLRTVAELITSGVSSNVYYVSLSGFDTHVNQLPQQERLLKQYAEAMQAFVADLKANGKMDKVLIMTFSEFGRRVKQNASGGTDHGTANNVFLIGGNIKNSKVFNEAPNLTNLDDGDLKYSVDFRNLYATILNKWLQVDDVAILGKKFDPIPFI